MVLEIKEFQRDSKFDFEKVKGLEDYEALRQCWR